MSFDETILLKIKREFATDEAVQVLLKKIADLEMEIGIFKSEISEKDDCIVKKDEEIHDLRYKDVDTKKGWLRDELIADINKEMLFYKNNYALQEKKYKELEILYSKALIRLQEMNKGQ